MKVFSFLDFQAGKSKLQRSNENENLELTRNNSLTYWNKSKWWQFQPLAKSVEFFDFLKPLMIVNRAAFFITEVILWSDVFLINLC